MQTGYFAHSLENRPPEEGQRLDEHLKNVAKLTKQFAESFGYGDWAYAAGLWHDIGKYSQEFQNMLIKSANNNTNVETKIGRLDLANSVIILDEAQMLPVRERGLKHSRCFT